MVEYTIKQALRYQLVLITPPPRDLLQCKIILRYQLGLITPPPRDLLQCKIILRYQLGLITPPSRDLLQCKIILRYQLALITPPSRDLLQCKTMLKWIPQVHLNNLLLYINLGTSNSLVVPGFQVLHQLLHLRLKYLLSRLGTR